MSIEESTDDALVERIVAFVIDFTLLAVASAFVWLVFSVIEAVIGLGGMVAAGSPGASDGVMAGVTAVSLLLTLAMWVVISALLLAYFGFLAAEGRQTLGMRMIDVEVVDADGGPVSVQQGFLRAAVLLAPLPLMALLDAVVPLGFLLALVVMAGWLLVELAVMAVSADHQRLGDRLADTYVVEDDLTAQAAAAT